jgi:hypothetical protein
LAELQLEALYESEEPRLQTQPPPDALCRCITLGTFYFHHLDTATRAFFADSADFASHVKQSSDPANELTSLLAPAQVLFPKIHTWMARCKDLEGLAGIELRRALALQGTEPPYIVFRLSRDHLVQGGVAIRRSTALDAIPNRIAYWDPDGLPTGIQEFVDGDIPLSALEAIEWRP